MYTCLIAQNKFTFLLSSGHAHPTLQEPSNNTDDETDDSNDDVDSNDEQLEDDKRHGDDSSVKLHTNQGDESVENLMGESVAIEKSTDDKYSDIDHAMCCNNHVNGHVEE